MANLTASEVLDSIRLDSSEVSLETVEQLIDDAVDEVNLRAGTSIPHMSGDSGSKSLTLTGDEKVAVKLCAILNLMQHLGLTLSPGQEVGGGAYGDVAAPFRGVSRRLDQAVARLKRRDLIRA